MLIFIERIFYNIPMQKDKRHEDGFFAAFRMTGASHSEHRISHAVMNTNSFALSARRDQSDCSIF
jgi:hypothetical protein